jgi:lipopolysaccharide heptosyltransferase III
MSAHHAMRAPDAIAQEQLRRVLVIKLRHHGDVLLSAPVLAALKSAAPQAQIDALVYAETGAMLRGHPALDQLHLLARHDKAGPMQRLRAEWRLLMALRSRRYDLLVHLTDHPRGAWLSWLLRPRWSVAFEHAGRQRWWKRSFSHLARQPRGTPRATVERHLDLLRRLGIHPSAEDKKPTLAADPQADARAQEKLRLAGWAGQPYAVVHPGSRWMFKTWTVQGNAQVMDHLAARGLAVVLTAAPDPLETRFTDLVLQSTRATCIDLRGRLSLEELASVIRRARVFVGVDSVPMHIAAAVGTPGVALFGPSNDAEWGPWSDAIQVVASGDYPCRPCGIDGCGGSKHSDCLATLPAGQVIAAIDRTLERHGLA